MTAFNIVLVYVVGWASGLLMGYAFWWNGEK